MTAAATTLPASSDATHAWLGRLRQRDFCFVHAGETLAALGPAARAGWDAFADSWHRLQTDTYMADGGRYRRRRHATLSADAHATMATLDSHQPHYQSLDYNRLNGGVARHFEPVEPAVLAGPTMQGTLSLGLALFQGLYPDVAAHIEVHQFRIEALGRIAGRPTPEGAHRDGVDFVLVLMVRRENVASGTTEIFGLDGHHIDSFTLTAPGDLALVHDPRASHGVTPIERADPAQPAWRDVLVATYRSRTDR